MTTKIKQGARSQRQPPSAAPNKNTKLKKIGRADLLIASVALARRATLVSRNLKNFGLVPGLQVENWVD